MPNSRSLRLLATVALLAAPLGLGGCSVLSQAGAPSTAAAAVEAPIAAPVAVSSDLAEAPAGWGPVEPPPAQPVDPSDDLALGKRAFAELNYGLAEQHFRRAVEKSSGNRGRDAEAWLGLAASYDRLRRFDFADRAYKQAIAVWGPTAEILNNQVLFLPAARRLSQRAHHAVESVEQGARKSLHPQQPRRARNERGPRQAGELERIPLALTHLSQRERSTALSEAKRGRVRG